ncbi:hypothetical protein [Atlantibacter sp.]|uniref:hypothetical protein n=1 Tax=Atlantibacter sp. TaxID=1903473 RepID=UPI0028968F6B|nr:hypothetical protein [Atlantibacter sp.]
MLASVLYGFALCLTEFRFDGDHPQLLGGLWLVISGLNRLADTVYDSHQQGHPLEGVELDRMTMAFVSIPAKRPVHF